MKQNSMLAMILAAPAVCELEGPIITGPKISNTFIIYPFLLFFIKPYGYDYK